MKVHNLKKNMEKLTSSCSSVTSVLTDHSDTHNRQGGGGGRRAGSWGGEGGGEKTRCWESYTCRQILRQHWVRYSGKNNNCLTKSL